MILENINPRKKSVKLGHQFSMSHAYVHLGKIDIKTWMYQIINGTSPREFCAKTTYVFDPFDIYLR